MSTASAPFFWLVCDGCGDKSTEGDEHVAWAEEAQACDMAVDSAWYVRWRPHPDHEPVDLCEFCIPMSGDDDEWRE